MSIYLQISQNIFIQSDWSKTFEKIFNPLNFLLFVFLFQTSILKKEEFKFYFIYILKKIQDPSITWIY